MTTLSSFRPPHVVDADARLARALAAGDPDALAELIERFGGAATAVAVRHEGSTSVAVAAFESAWNDATALEPGAAFDPWLLDHVVRQFSRSGGQLRTDAERTWVVRSTLDGLVEADRAQIRRRLFGGSDPVSILGRSERPTTDDGDDPGLERRAFERLTQRLAHLRSSDSTSGGEPSADGAASGRDDPVAALPADLGDEVAEAVADPATWTSVPVDLTRRVLARGGDGTNTSLGDRSSGAVEKGSAVTSGSTAVAVEHRPVRDAPPATDRDPSRGRQVRSGLIGAGVAVLALAAGVVLFSLGDTPTPPAFDVEMIPTGAIADVEGSVEVTAFDSGLRLRLDVITLPPRAGGGFYEARVELDDGTTSIAGTFRAGDDLTLWAAAELDRAVGLVVVEITSRSADGRVVLKADFPTDG